MTQRALAENEVAKGLESLEDASTPLPYIAKNNGSGTGTTVLENLQVTGNTLIKTPTAAMQAANKQYVDDVASGLIPSGKYLETRGGTMEGDIAMGSHKVTGLGTPTDNADAATKVYVDEQVAAQSPAGKYLPLTGGTMSGDIELGTNAIKDGTHSVKFNNGVQIDNLTVDGDTLSGLAIPTANTNATPKQYVDKLIPSVVSLTMSASAWNSTAKTYSFETAYPFVNYNIAIELAATATDAQITAWGDAKILGSAAENVATAKGTVPTVDLPIILTATPKKYVG